MQQAFIIDAVRSPGGRGKVGGALSSVHPIELLSQLLQGLVQRNDLDPGSVDDVITGCVSQVGEQSFVPGRMAWLAAGYPEHVPSTTVDRKCGSSQQAVHFAAQGIMAGAYDIVIACGVESMSRVPMGTARGNEDWAGPQVWERYAPGLVSQGVASDLVASRWGLTREELDAYASRSHLRAAEAREAGAFKREIIPIRTGAGWVVDDETIRPGTTIATLANLRPVFGTEEMSARFPEVQWVTSAGNSSQISDGASAILLMSERLAARLGKSPLARVAGFDVVGDSPLTMLTAPIPATRRLLAKTGLSVDDIKHFEVNEAFASVPLAWQREFGADESRLNPRGGAIALGHPLGASGARLMTTMVHALRDGGGGYGLQTMCEAGGMANATLIEGL